MQKSVIFRLSENQSQAVRFLSGVHVSLADGKKTSWITLTRTGSFTDPRYGSFDITNEMLLSMVSNFHKGTYGQDIVVDLNHDIKGGAAADIKDLKVEGNRLRALVEWTPQGIDAVKNKRMKYLSAEFHPDYKDNEKGNKHGPTLLGAALTVRPVIKRLDPVELAEQGREAPVYIHPELIRTFAEEAKTMKKYLQRLRAKLEALKLGEEQIESILNTFTLAMGDNPEEEHAEKLLASFEEAGTKLAVALEDNPGAPIQLTVEAPAAGVSADDVNKAVVKALADRDAAAVKLTEDLAAKVKLFSDTINKAEGLSDDVKKKLCEDSDLITADMTDEQVKKFADRQIAHGNDLSVAQQLSAMGYTPAGTVVIPESTRNDVVALQEHIDSHIGLKDKRKDLNQFCERVLAQFDSDHAIELADERKMLAGGATGIGDTSLPAGYRRTVIREALSDLNILNLVNAITDFNASAVVNIPYELRDMSGITNDAITYEGQEINGASISQQNDLAYVNAMKIALNISNEVIFFSRNNGAIDWDAYARNVQSNARIIRELVARRICNELQRSADAYGATAQNDTLTAQVDGATSTFKTASFPVVRPHQVKDLLGNNVGTAENPITVTLGGNALTEYDGTGNQAAGTYYRVTNHNLGYIQTVTEAGVAVAPAAATALVVTYSLATNVVLFDLDVPGGTNLEDHLNGLLRAVGARKAVLSGDRFINTDNMFSLMSPILNDTITNARAFVESQARNGTALSGKGDLSTIKGIEAFGTNAPGIDLGDERIIMGEAGLIGYAVVKPFETGQPFEAVGPNGKPTGKKVAYGEEYNAIKLPTPLRNRLTSVLAYSATGR